MNIKTVSDFLDYEVFPIIRISELLPQFEPADQGHYYRMTCPNPKCRRRTAIFEKGGRRLRCPKDVGCGFSKTMIELLAFPRKPHGNLYRAIVSQLCRHAGKQIPEFLFGQPGAPSKKKRQKKSAPTFETVEQFLERGGSILEY